VPSGRRASPPEDTAAEGWRRSRSLREC